MSSNALSFEGLVTAIQQTHAALAEQAVKAVNLSLTLRNGCIGYYIAEFELQGAERATYGDNLLTELAKALRSHGISGVGRRQLYNYLAFYRAYPEIVRTPSALLAQLANLPMMEKKVRTVSAQSANEQAPNLDSLFNRLSYSHLEQLVELEDPLKRRFYEVETLRGNWSVRELKRQIGSLYFERSGLSTDKEALARLSHGGAEKQTPRHTIRDPYVFEFLGLNPREVMTESNLEEALLDKLQQFLLELGHGFCFEARQKRLLIGGEYFFVDLVFYHRILKCHVLIELKSDDFRHEHLGQLNSYVGYYKKHEMQEGDQQPIGILLCTRKNHELVEFALAGMNNTLFVSRYQVQLPGKDEIEAFLHRAVQELSDSESV